MRPPDSPTEDILVGWHLLQRRVVAGEQRVGARGCTPAHTAKTRHVGARKPSDHSLPLHPACLYPSTSPPNLHPISTRSPPNLHPISTLISQVETQGVGRDIFWPPAVPERNYSVESVVGPREIVPGGCAAQFDALGLRGGDRL